MPEKEEGLQLNDEQRTRLLGLGLDPVAPMNEPDADELRGDLLCDILRCPLPATERVPSTGRSVSPATRSVFGPSLGQLLTDPETDITTLRRIKEYAKALGKSADSNAQEDIFLVVYFAAIARAMTSHGEGITEHSDEDLVHFFNAYAQTTWMRVDLRELFASTAQHFVSKG